MVPSVPATPVGAAGADAAYPVSESLNTLVQNEFFAFTL
jgi:hypothetical protein